MSGQPFVLSIALLGLIVGSFLNVVIHRLPRMMELRWQAEAAALREEEPLATETFNLATPRSRCPHCQHQISAIENIPVVSYLVLGGKCRACKAPISARYPVVELLSGILSGLVAWHFSYGLACLGALIFVWAMIALAFIDLDTMLLPDDITLPLLWLGLILNLDSVFVPLREAVLGAIAGYLALWSVFWLYYGVKTLTNKLFDRDDPREGMGYGDFKLLAAIGAWFGWHALPAVILLSSLVGAVIGISLIVFARHGRAVPIPFGPYLAAAGVLALFVGPAIKLLMFPA